MCLDVLSACLYVFYVRGHSRRPDVGLSMVVIYDVGAGDKTQAPLQ